MSSVDDIDPEEQDATDDNPPSDNSQDDELDEDDPDDSEDRGGRRVQPFGATECPVCGSWMTQNVCPQCENDRAR